MGITSIGWVFLIVLLWNDFKETNAEFWVLSVFGALILTTVGPILALYANSKLTEKP